jgi:hypothetical protein
MPPMPLPPTEPDPREYHFEVFADYRQVYLEDCDVHTARTRPAGLGSRTFDALAFSGASAAWVDTVLSPAAHARHLGVAQGTLCLLTARNVTVPLDLELRSAPLPPPQPQDLAAWDHIVEASLDLPSGCLLVHGATDGLEDEDEGTIAVAPGLYRARVSYGSITTVSENRLDGEDHYRVALWPAPGPAAAPVVLHSRAIAF